MLNPFDFPPRGSQPGPLVRALLAVLASTTILTLSLAAGDASAALTIA